MPQLSDGEGGGPIHAALAKLLGPGTAIGDQLLFASAGNTAERHWAGQFHANATGYHEWKPGVTDNALNPWGDEKVSVELCCKPGSRYDLAVVDEGSGAEAAACAGPRRQPRGPLRASFGAQLRHSIASACGTGRKVPFGGPALRPGSSHAPAGSVAFPADGPEVVAVGAVDHAGLRTAYSACGATDGTTKPDLVAPVPFLSAWRSRPFAGTSAAAPQAAALAGLVWSRHLDWKAGRVRSLLQTSARDLGVPGPDPETGFGLLHLPVAK